MNDQDARPLPLDGWHRARGARMVPFAGHAMPLQFEGIIAEHQWARTHAALFDVSHMGQIVVSGHGAGAALERLLPPDLAALRRGQMRYSLLLSDDGGILDDLMITNSGEGEEAFTLVVNGASKQDDIRHLQARLPAAVTLGQLADHALLALQGPEAAAVLDALVPGIAGAIGFLQATRREWRGVPLWIGRCGYTGEDGFEISLPADAAADFADGLLADGRVRPAGLGARDSLRLEAGLPLHGHDMDAATDPVSADLAFAVSRNRRERADYPGAQRIGQLLSSGAPRRRVGFALEGRLPAREGAPVLYQGQPVGVVTSGGFSPTLGRPIAMAMIDAAHSARGTALAIEVRGRLIDAQVVAMPFVPHRYHRAGASR